jgi:hypothetical protein
LNFRFKFTVDLKDVLSGEDRKLIVAERLYYEIEIVDEKSDSVKYLLHLGIIDLDNNYPDNLSFSINDEISNEMLLILYAVILILVLSLLFVYRFFRRKRRNSGSLEEITNSKNDTTDKKAEEVNDNKTNN